MNPFKCHDIFSQKLNKWMIDEKGIIFWTMSKHVADEQFKMFESDHPMRSKVWEVKEFDK